MTDSDDLKKTWHDSFVQLAYLQNDTSEEAQLRRIAIYSAQSDFLTGAAEIARKQGNTEDASILESEARSAWGSAIAAASDLSTDTDLT